jgi:uncharacterized membrane protein
MSMELTSTLADELAHRSAEDQPQVVIRNPERARTVLTVIAASIVVVMFSVLAVAMSLT